MLVIGDLSGIQDFLFDVREAGGKQAATLRSRSLRLQLIAECIARRVLWGLDLPESVLLYCAAGKFAIDGTGAASVDQRLEPIRAEIDAWLLTRTHGRLRCAIAADDSPGTAAARNGAANAALQRRKLRPWASHWKTGSLVIPSTFNSGSETELDAQRGRSLLEADTRTIELLPESSGDDAESIAGVSVRYSAAAPPVMPGRQSSISLERLIRHTPRHPDRSLVEFVDLARRSRGAPMLGVLKADADSLGIAIHKCLGDSHTFEPLTRFSQRIDHFFGNTLGREMSAPDSSWSDIYTIFAGGDDLLMVGPWNTMVDFAAHIHNAFMREFTVDGLTISAACAIIQPKFPIRLAAAQADDLLEKAKEGPKDQFAALGGVWKWSDHASVMNAGKRLADWVEAGGIQRGWLHTLLELTLLRRGESASRDPNVSPHAATSRLSYHVGRNWPRANDPGEKGLARRWVDTLIRNFDHYEQTKDPVTIHLPSVLRYAMLATRSTEGDIDE